MGSTTEPPANLFADPQGMQLYLGPSMQQPHRARQALRDAHEKKIPPLLGYYAGLSSVPITQYLAPMGFDVVWIDWEHTSCNVETMTSMVHDAMYMSHGRTIPFVRCVTPDPSSTSPTQLTPVPLYSVPDHSHTSIGYALDAGASIVVPQVSTVTQARHIISAAKFGTTPSRKGTRSVPPFRMTAGWGDTPLDPSRGDIWQNLNDQAAIIIQIESLEGIHNLDEILTECPEIDAVWLGAFDARVSMNLPAGFAVEAKEAEWLAAVGVFDATMKKHGKPKAGFSLGSGEQVKKDAADKSFMLLWADVVQLGMMGESLREMRAMFREG